MFYIKIIETPVKNKLVKKNNTGLTLISNFTVNWNYQLVLFILIEKERAEH